MVELKHEIYTENPRNTDVVYCKSWGNVLQERELEKCKMWKCATGNVECDMTGMMAVLSKGCAGVTATVSVTFRLLYHHCPVPEYEVSTNCLEGFSSWKRFNIIQNLNIKLELNG